MRSFRYIGVLAILAMVAIPASCTFSIIKKSEKFDIETLELTTYRSNSQGNQGKPLAPSYKEKNEEQLKRNFDTLDVENIPTAHVQRISSIANTLEHNGKNSANVQSDQNKYQEKLLQSIVDSLPGPAPPAISAAAKQKQEEFEMYQEKLLEELLVDYKGDVNCSCAGFTCICCTELAYQNLRTNYCTSMTYKPEKSKVAVALLLDSNVIESKDISLAFPCPICLWLHPSPIQACARYYIRPLPLKNTIEVCVDGDFFLSERSALDVHFNCVILGPSENFTKEIMEYSDDKPDVTLPNEKPIENKEEHDEKSEGKDEHTDNIPDQTKSNDVVNTPHLERHRRSITNKWRSNK